MVEAGQPAPDFTLPDQSGQEVTLSGLRGSAVVLYFYPKDDTPGCTKEACAFRDAFADYQARGARSVGVSADEVDSDAMVVRKRKLPYTVVADAARNGWEVYGAIKDKNLDRGGILGVKRRADVVDRDGLFRKDDLGGKGRG